jgi:hypothetical protein
MPTKVRPNRTIQITHYRSRSNGKETSSYTTRNTGSERITYDSGRRLPNGRWPWKTCEHVSTDVLDPIVASFSYDYSYGYGQDKKNTKGYTGVYLMRGSPASAAPNGEFDSQTVRDLLNQVDLNTSDSVLLYSGILQAVPLLGGALKFSSILNRAARELSKSFRKKPFTTVLKTLISADFIDRFVISPTIDDARKFADATNYVLRVIQTARERSTSRFALSSASRVTHSSSKGTTSLGVSGDLPNVYVEWNRTSYTTSKAFMLLEAKYDIGALDPIKFWAQRVGLTRPLDSVWDLVPFSFVVDYFTRAGDFISRLSDEMSRVEGLTGTITRIHDMWCSLENTSSYTERATGHGGFGPNWSNPYFRLDSQIYEPLQAVSRNSVYTRYRIPNPWLYLSSLSETLNEYLTVNTKLSATRKRTIAELVIQAKL